MTIICGNYGHLCAIAVSSDKQRAAESLLMEMASTQNSRETDSTKKKKSYLNDPFPKSIFT